MKQTIHITLTLILGLCLLSPAARAGADHDKPASVSPAFERLQKLVGRWEGTHKTEKGEEEKLLLTYALSSGNTTLVETMSPGTPHEMITVYHSDGPGVVMTHYCMLGNQPRMRMKKIDDQTFAFNFIDGTNMKKTDPHMHALKITLLNDKELSQEWTYIDDKKASKVEVFRFKRL